MLVHNVLRQGSQHSNLLRERLYKVTFIKYVCKSTVDKQNASVTYFGYPQIKSGELMKVSVPHSNALPYYIALTNMLMKPLELPLIACLYRQSLLVHADLTY